MPVQHSHDLEIQHRTKRAETHAPERHAAQSHLPIASPASLTLLDDARLRGRGNAPVRAALLQQAQQTHGNRAVQRFLHRTQISSTPPVVGSGKGMITTMPTTISVQRSGGEVHEGDKEQQAPLDLSPSILPLQRDKISRRNARVRSRIKSAMSRVAKFRRLRGKSKKQPKQFKKWWDKNFHKVSVSSRVENTTNENAYLRDAQGEKLHKPARKSGWTPAFFAITGEVVIQANNRPIRANGRTLVYVFRPTARSEEKDPKGNLVLGKSHFRSGFIDIRGLALNKRRISDLRRERITWERKMRNSDRKWRMKLRCPDRQEYNIDPHPIPKELRIPAFNIRKKKLIGMPFETFRHLDPDRLDMSWNVPNQPGAGAVRTILKKNVDTFYTCPGARKDQYVSRDYLLAKKKDSDNCSPVRDIPGVSQAEENDYCKPAKIRDVSTNDIIGFKVTWLYGYVEQGKPTQRIFGWVIHQVQIIGKRTGVHILPQIIQK